MDKRTSRIAFSVSLNALVLVLGIFIIFTAGSKAYTFGHNIFNEEAVSSEQNAREVIVTIGDNMTSSQMAELLYNKGLVKDKTVCNLQIKLSDYKDKFVAGTYTLKTSMKPTEMMKIMSKLDSGE